MKCLPLNLLEPTNVKKRLLRETYATYLTIVREALSSLDGVKSRGQLHNKTYANLRGKYNISSQLIIEATSYAWSTRKTIDSDVKKCVVRFDKRLFSFSKTERGNPVLSLRANNQRIGLPVSRDGAFERLQTHLADGWQLTSVTMRWNLNLFVVLSKTIPGTPLRRNWLGVDVNSARIAVSIIDPSSSVLKQTYYGKDVSTRQFNFERRRAALQQYRDTVSRSKTGSRLKRLSKKQRNYVRTRTWEISNRIVGLAKKFNAGIAVERLGGVMKRRGVWNAVSRRKTNRIPYGFLRRALWHVADREGVAIQRTDPKYTSQACPSCGHTSKANWKSYKYFRCTECAYEANRDRVASLNIALRAASTTKPSSAVHLGQSLFPEGSASVSRRVWQDEGFEMTASNNPELQAHKP